MDLNTIWFLLVGVLIAGYAVLDGFDLGTGVLHLVTSDERERRVMMNAIGPVWDGNEVWLLTGGGALFAAFPPVYATVFSGFYLAFTLLLVALILRAVSFEFRSKVDSHRWRRVWDVAFGVGSLVPALLFGVAVGNVLRGLETDAAGIRTTLPGLLNPYALLIGVLGLVMFVLHGATYLGLKTEGPLQARMRGWASAAWVAFIALYAVSTVASWAVAPYLFEHFAANPLTWVFFALLLAACVTGPAAVHASRFGRAFLASAAATVSVIALAAEGLFPRLVPARPDLAASLTIYNAASTPRTLETMLVIALVGMPLVVLYTVLIYRAFRGKTVLTPESY
ncbi:MAG TPA: cytochrome d ubiquinol oxidase subunit II [Gemmatimonadales bacterium]|nr:cytochrome d ubiquinol oxidase subunit II [Gemmatimonadales bacterium]